MSSTTTSSGGGGGGGGGQRSKAPKADAPASAKASKAPAKASKAPAKASKTPANTVLCRNIAEKGTCPWGARCNFSHDEELKSRPSDKRSPHPKGGRTKLNQWDIASTLYGIDGVTNFGFTQRLIELMCLCELMRMIPTFYVKSGYDLTTTFKSTKTFQNPLERADNDQYRLLQWWGQNAMLVTSFILRVACHMKDPDGSHLRDDQKESIRSMLVTLPFDREDPDDSPLGEDQKRGIIITDFEHIIRKIIEPVETSMTDKELEELTGSFSRIQALLNCIMPPEELETLMRMPLTTTRPGLLPVKYLADSEVWPGLINFESVSTKFRDRHGRGGEMPDEWSRALNETCDVMRVESQAARSILFWRRRTLLRRRIAAREVKA